MKQLFIAALLLCSISLQAQIIQSCDECPVVKCGTWKKMSDSIGQWHTIDTLGGYVHSQRTPEWIYSDEELIPGDMEFTLVYHECSLNPAVAYKRYRIDRITHIRQQQEWYERYVYIPPVKDTYEALRDSLRERKDSIYYDARPLWFKRDKVLTDTLYNVHVPIDSSLYLGTLPTSIPAEHKHHSTH